MCSTMKKVGFTAVAIVAGLFILNKALPGSIGTAWRKARTGIKNQVPVEFEIERVREQLSKLPDAMKGELGKVAEEIVALDKLKDEITLTRTRLDRQNNTVRTLMEDIRSAKNAKVVYDGRTYSVDRLKEKLDRDVDAAEQCQRELKAKESLLEQRERGLVAAREKISSMRAMKAELESKLATLEAELKELRLSQTRNTFHFDDSVLNQAKQTMDEIESRIKVERTRQQLQGQFDNNLDIPVEKREKTVDDVTKRAEAYLNDSDKADVASGK